MSQQQTKEGIITLVPVIPHLVLEGGREIQNTQAASSFLGKKLRKVKNPDVQTLWCLLFTNKGSKHLQRA